jgi:PAS domain S-box-containing protein
MRHRDERLMRRIPLLTSIFTVAVFVVAAVIIGLLYRTSLDQETARLQEVAHSQARMIEAIARHETRFSHLTPEESGHGDALVSTLAQVRDANERFSGFGRTGEFTLARREGDSIVYLLTQRHPGSARTMAIPFNGTAGEPMRRALSGLSGTVIGPDYRGVTVLAAHEPVSEFGLGVVAKIDMAEIQVPFVRAGLIGLVVALVTVLLGSLLFNRITNPVLQQLQESETRMKDSQKLAHLGSWTLDLVRNELAWSDEVYRVFGLQPQEFGATYEEFLAAVHPDDRAAVDAAYSDSVRDNRNGYEIEHRVVRKNTGEIRIVKEKCEHFRDGSGRIIRSTGMVHDITERRLAEESLRRSAATLLGILDATQESMWLFSTDGVVLQTNAIALTRFGKTSPEVLGKSMEEILSPELAKSRRARLQEVIRTARSVEFEDERAGMQFRHSFNPVLDAEGRVMAVASFSRDITESKRAEKALRESETKFRIVADNTYDFEFWLDPKARYIYASPSCERITGYKPEEFLADSDLRFRIAHPEDRQMLMDHAHGVELEEPGTLDYRIIHRNGSVRWIGHVCQPIFDASGKLLGTRGSNRDITERKLAEKSLRESEERLRKLYTAMSEGLVLHQMVYDDSGKAVDYRIVDVNPAFEAITGLSRGSAVGRLATELYGTGGPPYLDVYARVVETALPEEFETEFAPMAKCFHISVFSPGKGIFATVFSDITARKQTERRIAEQATMLAGANDAIIGYDAGYMVTFWNKAAELMYGYSEAEAMGRLSSDLLHPVYVGISREQLVERIATDGHVETESTRTTRDGRQLSVEAHVIVLRDEQGETTSYVSVDRDITERKRAGEELREAKELLEIRVRERTAALTAEVEERKRAEERLAATSQYVRSLIESSLDPLVTINAEGRITDVNEATIKATGVPREQLVGDDFSDYFTEPEKAREGYRQVFAQGFVTDYPLTIRHRDGHFTDVLYNATVYKDTRGNNVGVFAAARDVTDRKRAEAAVAEERQRFQDVLNMLPVYVILITPDYKVPFANRFFEERFGKSGGFRCFEYLFHRGEPCENCETMKVLTHKGPHHWEWLGPDGRNYDIYDFPFADVDGSPLIMEMGIDITEQKRAEQALQKAHDTMEVRVAERTAELKRSNEELEQFAYVASHDLQEPLRMVASYVQLLGQRYKGQLDEKADRYIAHASDGAIRMSQLVNDLLSLSRVGTRATPLATVRLDRIVSQARDNLATAIYQSGAEIEIGPLSTVSGDETQLVQLFQNLIDNAVKFHGPEPPVIRIDAETRGHGDAARDMTESAEDSDRVPSQMVTIRVTDNGIGIDPKYADRIFGLFKRLHSEKEYPGTGIGLAVCKKIVERHGGTIRVESEPGKGSTFIFTLPAAGRETP